MIVECGLSTKSKDRRKYWTDQGYVQQLPAEYGEIMVTPEDTFYVNVTVRSC